MILQDNKNGESQQTDQPGTSNMTQDLADKAGIGLGPISLSWADELSVQRSSNVTEHMEASTSRPASIARLTTAEWRAKYEKDGMVDLWVEEEFNAGSRLVVSDGMPHSSVHVCAACSETAVASDQNTEVAGSIMLCSVGAVYRIPILQHHELPWQMATTVPMVCHLMLP